MGDTGGRSREYAERQVLDPDDGTNAEALRPGTLLMAWYKLEESQAGVILH